MQPLANAIARFTDEDLHSTSAALTPEQPRRAAPTASSNTDCLAPSPTSGERAASRGSPNPPRAAHHARTLGPAVRRDVPG